MSGPDLLYGITPVQQCLMAGRRDCRELLVKSGSKSPRIKELVTLANKRRLPVKEADPQVLAGQAKTKLHQGAVLKCGPLPTYTLDDFLENVDDKGKTVLVALDQIEDPQNVGAIIRSSAFLGAKGLITLKNRSAPLSATVSKASAGAMEIFPIIQVTNLAESLKRLKREGFFAVGTSLETGSIDFREIPDADRIVLVLGNEGQGIRQLTGKRCDFLVHIPGKKETESLNVSAAAAILIQHLVNTR